MFLERLGLMILKGDKKVSLLHLQYRYLMKGGTFQGLLGLVVANLRNLS